MRIRLLVAGVAAALVVGAVPSPASAQTDGQDGSSTITATVADSGFRAVTTVAPITLGSALNTATIEGAYAVTVTETARKGSNPWSVTGALAGALSDPLVPANTIPTTAVYVHTRAVTATGGGGVSAAPTGEQDLSAARTLMSNTGQDVNTVYTGSYALSGTVKIVPPNGTKTGTYTGTFVVDLIN